MNWNWKEDMHPHPNATKGSVQARITLDNLTISVVGGPNLYGDGETTFEVGVKVGEDHWKVSGWNTEDHVDDKVKSLIEINETLTKYGG